MMSHIAAQLQPSTPKPDNYGALSKSKKKRTWDLRRKDGKPCPTIELDFENVSVKNHTETLETYSPSMARGSKTPKFQLLLTPTSAVSAVFESPLKASPSSSISSVQTAPPVPKDSAVIAELEDTSPGHKYFELEDTSDIAIRSSKKLSMASATSKHPASQALVFAMDQQFSRYETEIRRLQAQLESTEQSLTKAMTSAAEAKCTLKRSRETIADQEEEISHKSQLILELEKEVDHCLRHHLPPPTPSKSRRMEAALSRFNLESNGTSSSSADTPKPYLAIPPSSSSLPATSSNVHAETSLSAALNPSPRSATVAASSTTQALSAAGSPRPDYYNTGTTVPRPATCTPLTAKALSEAFSPNIGESYALNNSKWRATISHFNPQPEYPVNRASDDNRSTAKPQLNRRHLHSPTSRPHPVYGPSTQFDRDLSSVPPARSGGLGISGFARYVSDIPPMMSGGLGITGFELSDLQERRYEKNRAEQSRHFWKRDHDYGDSARE